MDWSIWILVIVLLAASPFYVFWICKFAGAGWVAGIQSYLRLKRRR
jgi:hypothetical protein